jgi:hypothetical protein
VNARYFFGALVSVTLAATSSWGAIHRVPTDAPMVNAAFASGSFGDTVIVEAGEHAERIVVPPGTWTLASEFVLSRDSADIVSTVLLPDGSADPDSQSIMQMANSSELFLSGLSLIGGGGTRMGFDPIQSRGGAVYQTQGNLTVFACRFVQNAATLGSGIWAEGGGDLALTNCEFEQDSCVQGTVRTQDMNLRVRNSRWHHNLAQAEPAVLVIGGAAVFDSVVVDSNMNPAATQPPLLVAQAPCSLLAAVFADNVSLFDFNASSGVSCFDCTAVIMNCTFVRNSAKFPPIELWGPRGSISGTLIAANLAHLGSGGCSFGYGRYALTGCRFENNQTDGWWSAVTSNGPVEISDCAFVGNRATGLDSGAAIACHDGNQYTVHNCLFSGNTPAAVRNFSADSTALDFSGNYWGDASGPTQPEFNPDGRGDRIIGSLIFSPFLTEPPQAAESPHHVALPDETDWMLAYPNPFNSTIRLSFNVAPVARELRIYNLVGQQVHREFIRPFAWQASWQPRELSTGIYLATVGQAAAKLIYVK